MRFPTLSLAFLAVALMASVTNAQQILDYKTAYSKAEKGEKPMLVLVTASWCPPCQRMKQLTFPQLLAKNDLKDCFLANVDVDKQPKIAKQLLDALPPEKKGFPQLLIFEKREGTWYRRYHGGFMTANHVREFVAKSELLRNAKKNNIRSAKKTPTPVLVDKKAITKK